MRLMAIVNELNRQYFMNTLNIDGASVIKKADADPKFADPSTKCCAYYIGNKYHGSIYVIAEEFSEMDEEDLRYVIFHEMAHQLVSGHGPDFEVVMKRFHGPSPYELVQFGIILKANIELKAKEGVLVKREMLPPIAQQVLRNNERTKEFKLFESLGEAVGVILGGIIFVSAIVMAGRAMLRFLG